VGGKGSVDAKRFRVARKVLCELTGAPYKVTSPRPESYVRQNKPKWYVTCLDGAHYEETVHAETVWSDGEGRTWIDSGLLGSTTNWVEDEYGEKGAVKAMDFDYRNLSVEEVQARLKEFPKVFERIETCKQALRDVSQKSGVQMEMICEGKQSVAWFLFRARVDSGGSGRMKLEDGLRSATKALKEAYDSVLEVRTNR
jgi:hypothetical protein